MVSKNWSRALSRYSRDLIVNTLVASPLVPVPARWRALRLLGVDVEPSFVAPGLALGDTSHIHIGKGTYISYDVRVDGRGPLWIGADCSLAARVIVITSTHGIGPSNKRAGTLTSSPVTIGDGSWIGAGAIIMPGVTIGPGCIIGAGAVVTKDCEANGVYAGVPARLVRSLT